MQQGENISSYNLLFNRLVSDPHLLLKGLPYSLSLMVILGVHELSHYLLAVYYHVRTTLPYFLPVPFFLGTFGAFIAMKSPTPHRKALFDVAIAGPLGGLLVTIPVLIWGLAFSEVVTISQPTNMLSFQALDPRFSCLLAILSKVALGSQLIPGKAISLHPAAIAGYIGLIITALNLMPVGQLDGGHIVHGMFGQGKAILIGQITRLLMFGLAFVRKEFLFWAIILFFMPLADQPALNDVSELDNRRDFLGLMSLLLLASILLPLPPTVAQWLNI
jgi:membrane-associated protease RseP (regulator of RpoE activity)